MEHSGGIMRIFAATIVAACGTMAISLPSAADEPTSSGTGVLINNSGDLVTNAHVISDCAKVKITGLGDASPLFLDIQNDLAVVRTTQPPTIPGLAVRKAPPRLGEDIAALGYPLSDILSDSIKI